MSTTVLLSFYILHTGVHKAHFSICAVPHKCNPTMTKANLDQPVGPCSSNTVLFEMMLYYKSAMERAQAQSVIDRDARVDANNEAARCQMLLHERIMISNTYSRALERTGEMLVLKHQGAYRLKRCFEDTLGDVAREQIHREHGEDCLVTQEWLNARIEANVQRAEIAIGLINSATTMQEELPDLHADEVLEGPASPISIDNGEETETDEDIPEEVPQRRTRRRLF